MKFTTKLLLFRLLNALALNTFYVPDEYYQSLEPAHRLVFGYGFETWEWRPSARLRSPLHPLLFAAPWWVLKLLHCDNRWSLILTSKLLQATIASLTDFYTYKLARKLFPSRPYVGYNALFISLASLYAAFTSVRAISNALEALLLLLGLIHLPWAATVTSEDRSRLKGQNIYKSLCFLGLAVALRPSSLLLLIPLLPTFLSKAFIHQTIMATFAIAALCFAIDSLFYSRLTFTPFNFVHFNIFQGGASFYGTHDPTWYILQGLPVVLGAWIPAFLAEAFKRTDRRIGQTNGEPERSVVRKLKILVLWTLVSLSFLPHKEHRFLLPVLPILHIIASLSFPPSFNLSNTASVKWTWLLPAIIHAILLVPAFLHMSAQATLPFFLSHSLPLNATLGVLAPCHSTTWLSYIHRPDLVDGSWFLTCDPPGFQLEGEDEADTFYDDPVAFLKERMYEGAGPGWGKRKPWPSHLVLFEALLEDEDVKKLIMTDKGRTLERTTGWCSVLRDGRGAVGTDAAVHFWTREGEFGNRTAWSVVRTGGKGGGGAVWSVDWREELILVGTRKGEVKGIDIRVSSSRPTGPSWKAQIGVYGVRWIEREKSEREVAVLGMDSYAALYDLRFPNRPIVLYPEHTSSYMSHPCDVFTPSFLSIPYLTTIGSDRVLRIWEARSGVLVHSREVEEAPRWMVWHEDKLWYTQQSYLSFLSLSTIGTSAVE
ncbi:glycosyltransferase family 22 protein [Atractiella rhizophila]|nr:glycosyltransferase family 22 protein [Atractiella rhizophila]